MGFCCFGGLYRFVICIDYRLIQTLRACVPHTPYTLVLKFVPPMGRGCGVATHAVGGIQATACFNMRMITPLEAVSRTYGILLFGWTVQICYMYRLPVNSNTACVRTAHTLHIGFKVCAALR